MIKKENGITLVALVVTIIVLLILAGVAISLTLGPEGIIDRSKNAVNTYGNSAKNEEKEMNSFYQEYDNTLDEYWPD